MPVQVAMQESGIDARSKHRDSKDSNPVLGNRKRNRRQDDNSLPPKRPEKQLRQYHAGHDQHKAGTQAAALLRDLKVQSWDREHDAVLGIWNPQG